MFKNCSVFLILNPGWIFVGYCNIGVFAASSVIRRMCCDRASVPISVIKIHIRVRGCRNVNIESSTSENYLFVLRIIKQNSTEI